jgi:hypothetical protein
MIRYSSFNYVSLLHSLLANVSVHRSREWGTIAAVVQQRPPWFIVFSRRVQCFVRGLRKNLKLGKIPIFSTGSVLIFFTCPTVVSLGANQNSRFPGTGLPVEVKRTVCSIVLF